MSVCDFLKDSKCTVTSSLDYTDCSDYFPADYGYSTPQRSDRPIHYSTHTDWIGPDLTPTVKSTWGVTTTSKYLYTSPDYDSVVVHMPKAEKVIKNIKVLKCRCCDAKLDSTKMYNNIIKCEYCDSDNYIELEDE